MPEGNLTRAEAQRRAELLRVDAYAVEIDVTTGPEYFRSKSTIRFECAEPGADTFLDLLTPAVHQIIYNGRELDPAEVYRDGRVHLTGLDAVNQVTVIADGAYGSDDQGLCRSVDPADDEVYLYSQFESSEARRVYACFEQPDLKATWRLDVIAPDGWEVLSNSPRSAAPTEPNRWSFEPTPLLPTYLTVIVAGPYHIVRDEHVVTNPDGTRQAIPLAVGCRRSLVPHLDADNFFTLTKNGLDFFIARFGHPYPFAKYDQMLVMGLGGAMEHPGCVTFGDQAFLFRSAATEAQHEFRAFVLLHEMAHMWFGDLVTMRWWDDLWLNESFATYAGALAVAGSTPYTNVWSTFATSFKASASVQDQLPTTHPIIGDVPDLDTIPIAFDRITYEKGASVLQQLAAWVGDDGFAAGVRDYFSAHAWGNTTAADFLGALADASGRDLGAWADEWLRTTGVNTLRPEFTLSADGTYTSFAIRQEAVADHPTLRSHRIAVGCYRVSADGALVRGERLELDIAGPVTDVPQLVGTVQPDLLLLNDGDLTYTKIRLDERSAATAIAGVSTIGDPLARALVWSAAWDMCRDAELAARDYVAMVIAGIDGETLASTVADLLGNCSTAIDRYADPAWRPVGRALVAAHARGRVASAEPGSDAQIAWLRALASFADDGADHAYLRGLVDGTEALDGLAIDGDLRWSIIGELAGAGQFSAVEIDAELDRDRTSSGEESAARARAAMPLDSAKEAAWQLIKSGEASPMIQIRTAAGFGHPGQSDLIARFTDDYFATVVELSERSHRLARMLITALYPREDITAGALARTDAFLTRDDLSAPLRRFLYEGRDTTARALRARERDAKAARS